MDDTARGIGDDGITGRGDESTRDYAATDKDRGVTDSSSPNFTSPAARTRTTTAAANPGALPDMTDEEENTDRRARAIRSEIERTREDMSETIDAIQEKLRPGNIVAEASDRIKHATTERVRQMADTASETAQSAMDRTRHMAGELAEGARQNAVPAVMIGVGLAWLVVDRIRRSSDRRGQEYWQQESSWRTASYSDADDYYRGGTRELGAGASRQADDYSSEYRSGASSRSVGMSQTINRAGAQFQRLLRNNPLMVGAAAVVIGAAVGMALPETDRENEWLGETRDNVVDRAQDLARDAAARVREAAGDVAGQVTSEVVSGKGSQP